MCDVVSCKECGAVAAGGEQAKVFSSRQLKKRAAAGAAIGTTATCHKCLEEKEQAKKERGTQHRLAQQLWQEERREAAGAEAAARAQRTAGTASRPRAFMAAAAGPYLQELVADGGGWRDGDNVVRGAGAQIVSVPRTGPSRLWLRGSRASKGEPFFRVAYPQPQEPDAPQHRWYEQPDDVSVEKGPWMLEPVVVALPSCARGKRRRLWKPRLMLTPTQRIGAVFSIHKSSVVDGL